MHARPRFTSPSLNQQDSLSGKHKHKQQTKALTKKPQDASRCAKRVAAQPSWFWFLIVKKSVEGLVVVLEAEVEQDWG
jgi:hypothetical protein